MAAFTAALAVTAQIAVLPQSADATPLKADPSTEAGASAQARSTGKQVEVTGMRGENLTTWANPDGSFTSVQTVQPTRVHAPDGSWKPIDLNLEQRSDGSIGPKTSTIDTLSFSGGGDDHLVRIAEGGKGVTLDWLKNLPKPRLQGDTATYPDVLSGVDLQMRAFATGFKQVLVVKDAQAARNPELAKLQLAMAAKQAKAAKTDDGGLALEDTSGKVVLQSQKPLMWDSSGAQNPSSAQAGGQGPEDVRATGPLAGDKVVPMNLEVSDKQLTVVPDQKMLADPATKFPVYIDPPVGYPTKTQAVYVASNGETDWTFDGRSDSRGIGRCSGATIGGNYYLCDSSGFTAREYFEFSMAGWNGRNVRSATFRIGQYYTFSCVTAKVELRRVSPLTDSGGKRKSISWSARPTNVDLLGDREVGPNRGDKCSTSQGQIEFKDNPAETNENLTSTMRTAVKEWPKITFGLNMADEDDTAKWKRLQNNPALEITYNTRPDQPRDLKTGTTPLACQTGANRPYLNELNPYLRATVGDKDNQNLISNFEYWSLATPQTRKKITTAAAKAGQHSVRLPNLANGSYGWQVYTDDGSGAGYNDNLSPKSAVCEFTIDTSLPSPPTISLDPGNPYDNTAGAQGGPSQSGVFRFTPAADDKDVNAVEWALDNSTTFKPATKSADGSAWTAEVRPGRYGLLTLFVRTIDKAGNRSKTPAEYPFEVKRPECQPASRDCPVSNAWWKLDGDGADSTTIGTTHPLTLNGTAAITDGQVGKAARFAGKSTSFAESAPFTEFRSDKSFTLSTWVRLSQLPTANATILSKNGLLHTGISIGFLKTLTVNGKSQEVNSWYAMGNLPNEGESAPTRVLAGEDSAKENLGSWVHLAATYDNENETLTLYVGGQPVLSTHYVAPDNAAGPVEVGRHQYNKTWVDPWSADVDDVRIFQSVLKDSEIDELAHTTA
ncbi:LamG domain-containing protein [Actinomadura gamaensis]|uniref:LamG domain-containing protein n=1 Tax=Actinomadura gamaensis TaxID=1763541 RepID=A0ABV9TUJ5_9ACTN